MAYRLQVIRISQNDCVDNLIPIGHPMIIDAECLTEAKAQAAGRRLAQRHNQSSVYHTWLVGQQNCKEMSYFPYRWAVEQVEIVE